MAFWNTFHARREILGGSFACHTHLDRLRLGVDTLKNDQADLIEKTPDGVKGQNGRSTSSVVQKP
ncbi:hypothetical protein PJP08_29520, partial [Mycobacterium kansasii]